jgi:hypothetical protein
MKEDAMLRVLTVVVLGMFLSPQVLCGQTSASPHPIKVRLSVSAPDALGASIRVNVVRELEAQGDMAVTELNPNWILQIAGLETECARGPKGLVVVSVILLETFSNAPLKVFLSDKLDGPTVTAIGRLTSGLFRLSRHWIEAAPASDVKGLTERIASRSRSAILYQQGGKAKQSPVEK